MGDKFKSIITTLLLYFCIGYLIYGIMLRGFFEGEDKELRVLRTTCTEEYNNYVDSVYKHLDYIRSQISGLASKPSYDDLLETVEFTFHQLYEIENLEEPYCETMSTCAKEYSTYMRPVNSYLDNMMRQVGSLDDRSSYRELIEGIDYTIYSLNEIHSLEEPSCN